MLLPIADPVLPFYYIASTYKIMSGKIHLNFFDVLFFSMSFLVFIFAFFLLETLASVKRYADIYIKHFFQ